MPNVAFRESYAPHPFVHGATRRTRSARGVTRKRAPVTDNTPPTNASVRSRQSPIGVGVVARNLLQGLLAAR